MILDIIHTDMSAVDMIRMFLEGIEVLVGNGPIIITEGVAREGMMTEGGTARRRRRGGIPMFPVGGMTMDVMTGDDETIPCDLPITGEGEGIILLPKVTFTVVLTRLAATGPRTVDTMHAIQETIHAKITDYLGDLPHLQSATTRTDLEHQSIDDGHRSGITTKAGDTTITDQEIGIRLLRTVQVFSIASRMLHLLDQVLLQGVAHKHRPLEWIQTPLQRRMRMEGGRLHHLYMRSLRGQPFPCHTKRILTLHNHPSCNRILQCKSLHQHRQPIRVQSNRFHHQR